MPASVSYGTNFTGQHTMDQERLEHRRSERSESVHSTYSDWLPTSRRSEGGGPGGLLDFNFGDDIVLMLGPLQGSSTSTPTRESLAQDSGSGAIAPQPHHQTNSPLSTENPSIASSLAKERANQDVRVSRTKTFFKDWWFWEMLGASLSIGCMTAVVILALHLDQTSLSDWDFVMAPSTVISTLITLARTAMLLPVAEGLSQLKWVYFSVKKRPLSELEAFDDASRGPWGSLTFFWKIKARSLLALCGAFVTIAALGMGPFAQQTVLVQLRSVPRPGVNASIPVASIYHSQRNDLQFKMDDTPPDVRMQGAVMNGLFDFGVPFEYQCPSGNCTWPDFSSLGVCSTCANVTDSVKIDNFTNNAQEILHITTPGGGVMSLFDRFYGLKIVDAIVATNSSLVNLDGAAGISGISVVQVRSESGTHTEPLRDLLDVTECHISWCLKQYKNLQVVNGSIQNHDVQDISLRIKENNLTYGTSEYRNGTREYFPTTNDHQRDSSAPLFPFPNSSLLVSNYDADLLAVWSRQLFTSSLETIDQAGLNIQSALQKPANVSALIANVTDSMSHVIRTGRNSTVAPGIIWDQDAFVSIQWAWLTLPIGLALLSAVFLIATLLLNSNRGAPLWKSALLPYLFHGLPEDAWDEERREQREGLLERRYEMEHRSEEIEVRLGRILESEDGGVRETRFVRW